MLYETLKARWDKVRRDDSHDAERKIELLDLLSKLDDKSSDAEAVADALAILRACRRFRRAIRAGRCARSHRRVRTSLAR